VVQNVNPTFVKTPNRGLVQISTATGTGTVTLYTGGANGSKIVSVNMTNSSTAATVTMTLQIASGGTNYPLVTSAIPGGAGTNGTNATFAPLTGIGPFGLPIDSDGNQYLLLASSADTLVANLSSGIQTTGGLATFYTVGGDF
jgi:hypothetical protein